MTKVLNAPRAAAVAPGRMSRMARGGQAAGSFVAVLSAYWLYWLIAVPLVEPQITRPDPQVVGPDRPLDRDTPSERTLALSKYLPPGSWELEEPFVWETDKMLLLLKTPQPAPNGKVEIKGCTVLFFEKGRAAAVASGSAPVIMQARNGALLEFDEKVELRSMNFNDRKLIGGRLHGPIVIQQAAPGPDRSEDLVITTEHDLELIGDKLYSPDIVKFRKGKSHGQGRELEIVADSDPNGGKASFGKDSIRLLRLKRDVDITIALSDKETNRDEPGVPQHPLRVTCKGPFEFDFQQRAAYFRHQVDVSQLVDGPANQLNCEMLKLVLAPAASSPRGTAPPAEPAAGRPSTPSSQFQLIEATGDPVTINAPSQGLFVRTGGIKFYPDGSGKLGRVIAGPGVMEGKIKPELPDTYRVHWFEEMRFEPDQDQHVASLRGKAMIWYQMNGQSGEIHAEELFAWLTPPPANSKKQNWQVDRALGEGNVTIETPQLVGSGEKVEAWFQWAKTPTQGAGASTSAQNGSGGPASGTLGTLALAGNNSKRYSVQGEQIQTRLIMTGDKPALDEVVIVGNHQRPARLEDISPQSLGQKPMVVAGGQLHVSDVYADRAHVTINGLPQVGKLPAKPALVEAEGAKLEGHLLEVDRPTGRAWVEGPGRMSLEVAQDLDGKPLAKPQPLEINWQQRMELNGNKVSFVGGVILNSQQRRLMCTELEGVLDAVDFSRISAARQSPGAQPKLLRGKTIGETILEGRELDEAGVLAAVDYLKTRDLSIDNVSGAISGPGPGLVTRVMIGGDDNAMLPALPAAQARQPKPTKKSESLKFLKVTFEGAVSGNLHQRTVTMGGPTTSVYGPVPNWNATLDENDVVGLPQSGIVLNANSLTVSQRAQLARPQQGDARSRSWLEFKALGNILIRGESGRMTAIGHVLTFDEEKSLLSLSGDGMTSARFRRDMGGNRPAEAAGDLQYNTATQHLFVNGMSLDGSMPLQNLQRPPQPTPPAPPAGSPLPHSRPSQSPPPRSNR